MTSLLDIGPLTEEILVRGKSITVNGFTPEGFFHLISSFPEIGQLANLKNADAAALLSVAPASIAMVVAIATTDRANYGTVAEWKETLGRTVKIAAALSVHHQLAIVNAAIRLTFPEGVGPFVAEMSDLTNSVKEVNVNGPVSDMTSSKSSRSGFVTDSVGMRLGKAARSVN